MHYYNEIDQGNCEWLLELMAEGLIPVGYVDRRSIKDVRAEELEGFVQCHFFAGVGVWPYALRLAGWPDDRPVWTGSCPCPSFSAAGKGGGFDDPRHLWPDWYSLIEKHRPPVVFGEQVDAAIKYGWLDLVQVDMEMQDYAVGSAVLGACSVGAPHRRQRLYFVADATGTRHDDSWQYSGGPSLLPARLEQRGGTGDLAESASIGRKRRRSGEASGEPGAAERSERLRVAGGVALSDCMYAEQPTGQWAGPYQADGTGSHGESSGSGESRGVAYSDGRQPRNGDIQRSGQYGLQPQDGGTRGMADAPSGRRREFGNAVESGNSGHVDGHGLTDSLDSGRRPGPVNGFWRDADWIFCTDGKWRAVRPGSQPLATGAAGRVGRLRGYGNAITAQVAAAFVASYMELERV